MEHRVTGFDVVKCAAIVLVVFGHVWRGLFDDGILGDSAVFARVDQMVYLFHMPVFFFLAGLFFSAAPAPATFVTSRATVLLWPMLLWSAVDGLAKFAVGATHDGTPLTLLQALHPLQPDTGIFWFLWALFFLSLLAYVLAQLPRSLHLLGLFVLSVAAITGTIGAGPFDSLWPVIIHMPEFLAGVALATLNARHRLLGHHLMLPGLVLFAAGQALLALGLAQGGLWAEFAMGLATLGFVLWLANLRLPATVLPGVTWLGRLTMPIYLTHILFTAATRMVLERLGITDLTLHLIAGTLIGIAGPVVLYLLAQRLGLTTWVGFDRPARKTAQ